MRRKKYTTHYYKIVTFIFLTRIHKKRFDATFALIFEIGVRNDLINFSGCGRLIFFFNGKTITGGYKIFCDETTERGF